MCLFQGSTPLWCVRRRGCTQAVSPSGFQFHMGSALSRQCRGQHLAPAQSKQQGTRACMQPAMRTPQQMLCAYTMYTRAAACMQWNMVLHDACPMRMHASETTFTIPAGNGCDRGDDLNSQYLHDCEKARLQCTQDRDGRKSNRRLWRLSGVRSNNSLVHHHSHKSGLHYRSKLQMLSLRRWHAAVPASTTRVWWYRCTAANTVISVVYCLV